MYHIQLTEYGHIWEKQNLVTQFNGRTHFDKYKCKCCGIIGTTTSLTTIKIKSSYNKDKVYSCLGVTIKPKEIVIIKCYAHGPAFKNLTPGSKHVVILPPEQYKNDKGVWVMGIGEPVKVLSDEFIPA